ncbi:hypothetical protein G3I60_41170 [Streptomyces sp. SID13666]|uniref:DUF6745 domain-containing protein n=1 Tax=unclassified Streptomyces TaxID=2593676 RepID=UPI0013C23C7B|nr:MULTISPECIES: hypothetical protein [unclassified Streptomyces]NEA60407.1 hypothetical protein [Streptomyces sp. SID13666]NEA76839.1 hypothetical protein [Streptomyces sp. SID13588]
MAHAVRNEWLGHGLCTLPADRAGAEDAVTGLYQLIGEARPRFSWITSPAAAPPVLAAERQRFHPPRSQAAAALGTGTWTDQTVGARLAYSRSDLRERLDVATGHPHWRRTRDPWLQPARAMTSKDALETGAPLHTVLEATVRASLQVLLGDALPAAIRTAMLPARSEWLAQGNYGQHDAYWLSAYDVHARTESARYRDGDVHQLGLWAALVRSAGWWWPGEGLCVMTERPAEVHTEPLPNGRHGELRLHHESGPAVRYADGAELYALHGTPVLSWDTAAVAGGRAGGDGR